MIFPDKKKAQGMVIARMDDKGNTQEGPVIQMEEEMGNDEALKAIAADMIQAFHSSSAHDLMIALKAFMAQCEEYDEEHDLEE